MEEAIIKAIQPASGVEYEAEDHSPSAEQPDNSAKAFEEKAERLDKLEKALGYEINNETINEIITATDLVEDLSVDGDAEEIKRLIAVALLPLDTLVHTHHS